MSATRSELTKVSKYDSADPPTEAVARISGQELYFGVTISPRQWTTCLHMAEWGVMVSAPTVLQRIGVRQSALRGFCDIQDRLNRAIAELESAEDDHSSAGA